MIKYPMFHDRLDKRAEAGLLRHIHDRASGMSRTITINGRELLNFASNDYLGLANDPRLAEAAMDALRQYGSGAGASRLISGGTELHAELEARLAAFKGTEAALLFNSGYAANTGALPALAGAGDAIMSDELNHASLIDGCRLSQAAKYIYRHRDMAHLENFLVSSTARRKIVATDSVFSMDGRIAPLPELYRLCQKHQALLYIDDAHGTGVLGGQGPDARGPERTDNTGTDGAKADSTGNDARGALAHFGLKPEPWVIQMGTLSKAMGSFGAFVAGDRGLINWLINSARSLIYSTALPPPVVAASIAALNVLESDTAPSRRLWHNRARLARGIADLGLDAAGSETPIIPVILGSVDEATSRARHLMEQGIYAPAIRPPTVKEPRLRLTVTAAQRDEDLQRLLSALAR